MKHLFIIALGFLVITESMAKELPPAPKGYEWIRCGDNKMGLLKPKGWFHRVKKKGDTETHAVSIEDSKKHGIFKTGLTLNIVKHVDKKTNMSASEYAEKFIKKTCASKKVLIPMFSKPPAGPFKSFGCRIRSQKKGDIPIVIHFFILANDKKGTLFLYQFEAPENSWDEAWKTGEILMKKIWVDDEI